MIRLMFFMAAITIPISLIFNRNAVGLIGSLIFLLFSATFVNPGGDLE